MKAIIKNSQVLHSIKSASAIGKIGKHIFIVSDNSNFLSLLNNEFELQEKLKLYESNLGLEEISKPLKADLECFLSFPYQDKEFVLLLGSGSFKEKRDNGFLLHVDEQGKIISKEISLTLLYNEFRKTSFINIEGLIIQQDKILFFSRGNSSDSNRVFSIDIGQFLEFLFHQRPVFSGVSSYELTTPLINKTSTGITEAFYANGIFLTATAEQTHSSFDDGAIEGSMFLQMQSIDEILSVKDYAVVEDAEGNTYKKKIEGVPVKDVKENQLTLWAVTDNDGGDSDLLEIELTI
jgi:hypothetical protein